MHTATRPVSSANGGWGGELPAGDFDLFHGISGQGYYYDPANGGGHLGDLFREQALQTLSAFKPNAPFCLVVCSKEVHEQDEDIANPYQPMDKFRHLYENITFPRPATANRRSFEKLPPFLQTSLGQVRWEPRFSTDALFQKTMKEYYQVLSGLDDICGSIVDMLVQKGVMDETIIVFTSDNGNMLGDHDLAAKWFMFEESIRVPLIIHAPQIFGSSVVDPSTALNIDIAPTLLALANVPIPEAMQGRSLYPAPEAALDPAPRTFLYEHLLDIPGLAKSEGVRSERFKYIKYYDGDGIYESLFDLLNDPFEETDLARTDRGAEMLPALRQTLARLIAAAG